MESPERPLGQLRDWSISYEEMLTAVGLLSIEKRRLGVRSHPYVQASEGRVQKGQYWTPFNGAHSSVVSRDRKDR